MSEPQRVSKILSARQICSRREADHIIESGWVLVNGQVATVGQKALETDSIELLPPAHEWLNDKITVILNKPVGYVSGQAEDDYIPAVKLITSQNRFGPNPAHINRIEGLAPAGRLDIDSKGLLILTQDGVLAKKVIGADSTISKEYVVKVDKSISDEQKRLLESGLSLDGKKLKPATVQLLNPQLMVLTLTEGKKRQIRRMCELVDLKVIFLKRTRVGNIELGDLPEGKWRFLTPQEKAALLAF